MSTEAANILWLDSTFFDNRYNKSSSALVAIKEALERNHPLKGREEDFLEIYYSISKVQPDFFAQVWSEPTAHFWVRIAYELVKNCLTGEPMSFFVQSYCEAIGQPGVQESLVFHLDEFKKFALAIHYLSRNDYVFTKPWTTSLPLAIPGSRLFLEGIESVTVTIHALRNGELELNYAGKQRSLKLAPDSSCGEGLLRVAECPVVSHKDCQLRLQPYSLNLPGFEDARLALEAGIDYQRQNASLVKNALILVECYQPRTFLQLRDFLKLLVLKPLQRGHYTNLSHSELPGVLICSIINNPLKLADTFIHEFHHNRLFFIEEVSPVLLNSVNDSPTNNRYYSPWRDDLRPLRGLLHALYVYIPVGMFWLHLYQGKEFSGRQLDYISSELVRIPLQLKIAVHQLERYAHFTELGHLLFAELKADVSRLEIAIQDLVLPSNIPAIVCLEDGSLMNEYRESDQQEMTAKQSILKHIKDYDSERQCEDLIKSLGFV